MRHLILLLAIGVLATAVAIPVAAADKALVNKTVENLKSAITGESTASAKYAAYAKKALEEGYPRVALLFEAASKAEAIHAGNHRAVVDQMGASMGEVKPEFTVKSTKENLEDAIKGESYEVSTMYPEFIKVASASKSNSALLSYKYAYQTEQKHKALYQQALAKLLAQKAEELPAKYMVCTTCGNTYDNEAAARCGICMTPKERFLTIE
jgi:rubrerythrin